MKFQIFSLFRLEIFALLLLLAGAPAMGAEDDLPPPTDGQVDELPSVTEPAPQADLTDGMPADSGTSEALPEPSIGKEAESPKNVVNHTETTEDNIFLPSPSGGEDIGTAPLGGGSSAASVDNTDWKGGLSSRPTFTLMGGIASRNYGTSLVPTNITGYSTALSARVMELGDTLFLHGLAGFTYFPVGQVGGYADLHDKTYHLGGMLELGLGRRFSIFASAMMRWNNLTFAPVKSAAEAAQRDNQQLRFVGEAKGLRLGLGVQYDFYVIPHGSLGVLARYEKDIGYVMLTMAMEPAPPKRLSLNFDSMNR